jgi:hypothetical protein
LDPILDPTSERLLLTESIEAALRRSARNSGKRRRALSALRAVAGKSFEETQGGPVGR